ncbi:MAG: sodium/solute symporter, partial [Gammaproteobacteria bacterium]|nr:sodium/solute symporter [Gammaproteobacteria bacterium]
IMVGVASLLVAPILIRLFYPFYRQLGITTSFEYINHRFGPNARFAVSMLFILARVGWLGVVIYSPALAISVVTGLNLYAAIVLMGVLAVSYTTLGGLAAVLWTDLLQFAILLGGAIWVAGSLIVGVPDGVSGIFSTAHQADHLLRWDFDPFSMTASVILIAYFFNHLQDYGADQITVQRMMSIDTSSSPAKANDMDKALWFNAVADLLIFGLLLFVGLGLFAYYQNHPELIPADVQGDRVLPHYIVQELPNGVSGLLITAIFAAAMSSMDSGINSLSTVIVRDFVQPLRKELQSEQHDVWLARILTIVLGTLAIVAACYAATIQQVLKAALTFLGLFTGPILALFLLGMLTRRGNYQGWLAAMIASVVAT